MWQSTDPILEKYLPTGNSAHDGNLPGMGGIYNPLNLATFTYSHQNPVKLTDPDGNAPVLEVVKEAFQHGIEGAMELAEEAAKKVPSSTASSTIGGVAATAAKTLGIVAGIALNPTPLDEGGDSRDNDRIPLFRAVSPEELKQIRATRTFINPKGLESKYFSLTPGGAKQYAKMAEESFGDAPYTLVGTTIPKSQISPDMLAHPDRGIPTVVVPTPKLPTLTTPVEMGKANTE